MEEPSIDIVCDALEAAAELDSSELAEWWSGLTALRNRVLDCASPEFERAYEAELRSAYDDLKTNYEIVEETRSQIVTYRELRLIG